MPRLLPGLLLCWLVSAAGSASANESPIDDDARDRTWDAAVGVAFSHAPTYAGSAERRSSLQPGLALRWRRLSLATRSAFAVYRGDAAAARGGGLRLDVLDGARWRLAVGLRGDSGREATSSPALAGLGDIRATLLVRASLSYRLDPHTRLTTTLLADLLGRGGGRQWVSGASRDWPLGQATTLTLAASVSAADRRYHTTWFGVTPAQSQASGYAVHRPGGGIGAASLGLSMRSRIDPHWAVFGGAAASRLLGPAADSPFVRRRTGLSATAGLVYAF